MRLVRLGKNSLSYHDLIRIQLLLLLDGLSPLVFRLHSKPALAHAIDDDIRQHNKNEEYAH